MAKEKTRYKYDDYIIRPIKGRYYVYKLETVNGEVKEHYVGPLVDIAETYIKLKNGDRAPITGPAGFEPATTSSAGWRSVLAELRAHIYFTF